MNNKLMEITDNIGIVTDDIGKMWAVMASSSKDMEDILRRENILEEEKNRLEQINKEFKKHKANKYLILAPIFALIIGNAIAFNYVSKRLGPNVELDFKIILAAFGTYGIFVVPTLYPVVKELFTFRKRKALLNAEEKVLEENIPELEEKLERLKEQAKFQELGDVEVRDLESNWSNALEPTSGIYRQITNDVTRTYENNVLEKNESFNTDSYNVEKPHTLGLRRKD